MEKELDKVLEEAMETPGVSGVVIADHQGLCVGSRGAVSSSAAGVLVALAEHACRLQPNLRPPVLTLTGDKTQCIIQRHGTITAAIFKDA